MSKLHVNKFETKQNKTKQQQHFLWQKRVDSQENNLLFNFEGYYVGTIDFLQGLLYDFGGGDSYLYFRGQNHPVPMCILCIGE